MKVKSKQEIMLESIERHMDVDLVALKERYKEFGKHATDKLWKEIPDELKPTARLICTIASRDEFSRGRYGYGCLRFRCLLYLCMRDINEKMGDDYIMLEHGWWTDAVHFNPEDLIKITNGLIGWCGDLSCEMCGGGPEGNCKFCLTQEEMDDIKFEMDYQVSSG